jgi:cytochrome c oxidase subunit 2
MKGMAIRALVPTLSVFSVALAFCVPQPIPVVAEDQKVQVIELTAKKYEYSPSPVRVKAGTKVQLKITASDHDHGFKIANVPDGSEPNSKPGLVFPSAQECWQLKKGETTTIEFFAQRAGTYTFKCCHTCGLGHRGMKGQIIVDPATM